MSTFGNQLCNFKTFLPIQIVLSHGLLELLAPTILSFAPLDIKQRQNRYFMLLHSIKVHKVKESNFTFG